MDEEQLNDQFVIETLQSLLLEYSEPYIEKRARTCGTSADYESEFFVSLEQITKNEQQIKNLIELCMFVLDKAQQRVVEREEEFAQHEEQINQLQERVNFESKNSKQYQKMLKEETLKVKEQLEIISQLEQQVTERDNQLMILKVNEKHKESQSPQKLDQMDILQNNKLAEELKQQQINQKIEINQLKENIDYYKNQYQRQATELEDSLNENQILRMEKIKNDSTIKLLEQEIVKLNQIILEYELKMQSYDTKFQTLNKQIYDLQNASACKTGDFNNDLSGSMAQRSSIQTSTFQYNQNNGSVTNSMVNNIVPHQNSNLKNDLPELSYRSPGVLQFNTKIDEIQEVSENLEQSNLHSKKVTEIPSEFQNNVDIKQLEEKLQKLATPRQIVTPRGQQPQQSITPRQLVPKIVQESQDIRAAKLKEKLRNSDVYQASPRIQLQKQEEITIKQEPQPITIRNEIDMGSIAEEEYETYFYEAKVKQPQIKQQNKIIIPPLAIQKQNDQQSQQQPQSNKQIISQEMASLKPQTNIASNLKQIYQANEVYFNNMKIEQQQKIQPALERGFRQSVTNSVFGQPKATLIKRDPYKEFFELLCQCVKLNSDYFDEIVYIDTSNYYAECKSSGKPFNEWEQWIKNKLEKSIIS